MMAEDKKTNADAGTEATDSVLDELEKKIKTVYRRAYNELRQSIIEFNNNYKVKSQKKIQQLQDGKITQEEYDAWEAGQAFQSKMWKEKKSHLLNVVNSANQKAVDLVNGQTKNVFSTNANYIGYELEQDVGASISFSLYDSNTIARLIKENPQLLPQKKLDGEKDKAWNNKKVVSAIQQGILQGRTIPQIAQSLSSSLAESNMKAMIRTARTAMTSAQNAGRIERLHEAEEMGIRVQKRWMATLDNRTRDSHAELDGETINVDKKFSNGLMYPGDPSGDPKEVYNCRCTLVYIYPEHEQHFERTAYYEEGDPEYDPKHRNYETVRDMTYEQWVEYKQDKIRARYGGEQKPVFIEEPASRHLTKEEYDETKVLWDNLSYEEKRIAFDGGDELLENERQELADMEKRLKELNHENVQLRNEKRALNREMDNLQDDNSKAGKARKEEIEKRLKEIEERREKIPDEYDAEYKKSNIYKSINLVDRAESENVQYELPDKAKVKLTDEKIIETVAGGDMTGGSCASAAMCYVGQQEGYDVHDFRGGASRAIFSGDTRKILYGIAEETGYPVLESRFGYGVEPALELISKCEPGKQYYLCAGRHASIVRIDKDGIFEYLELQSGIKNGWKKSLIGADGKQDLEGLFGTRFGCDPANYDMPVMIDVEGIKGSKLFHRALGYINTKKSKQMKGEEGFER